MLIASFFKWWYGAGLVKRFRRLLAKLGQTTDFFSIDLLVKTLFQPFKMIDSQKIDGSIEMRLRNWLDRLISRMIGAMIRTFTLLAGIIVIVFQVILSVGAMVFWLAMPLVPVASTILFILGATPSWLG